VARIIADAEIAMSKIQCQDLQARRRLWKTLILKYHPDKNPKMADAAAEVCKKLNAWAEAF
ncbi:unnamed protein product, partial [Symbiodinium sp. CCMP2456]